jgi:hypothetical protein
MPWIKAKNGNVLEVVDLFHAEQLLNEGHEAFVSDPREKGAKPAKWDPRNGAVPTAEED